VRILFFDCFAGAAGDMIIGALLDLGLDFDDLRRELSTLPISNFEITCNKANRRGIAATKFNIRVEEGKQPPRRLSDIVRIIGSSALSDSVKQRSISVFEKLAKVEARVHGTTPDQVHFHEVGAIDSIIDTVGAMIGFELLGFESFAASPLRLGRGFVNTAHGRLPIPAPATAALVEGLPVYAGDVDGEFVTPTGAAILSTICRAFGPMPWMTVTGVGYGAGSRDPADLPNVLRLLAGEALNKGELMPGPVAATEETVVVIETNIDDMNPQICGFVMERALMSGARDAFVTPVQMKKGRPGVLLTVVCDPPLLDTISNLLLTETTTLGIRYYEAKRRILERSVETVETLYGPIRVKVARQGGRTLHFRPEYEDCARVAIEKNVPLLEVESAANAAYRMRLETG
jgi:hypothetical protein